MRRSLALLLALLLLAVLAVPAEALTIQRTFRGSIGTDGVNGTHYLNAFTDGTGQVTINLKHMRVNTTYTIEIRSGTCAKLGSILIRPGTIRTGATGAVSGVRNISQRGMNNVWPASRNGAIAVRYYYGSSIRCGNLGFFKATRIAIPAYNINLPVIKSPSGYPYCKVAMYLRELSQPREPGVTFIFAHARTGMFLPLLTASKINNGAAMIGKIINVYTSDSRINTYKITQVRRHVKSIQNVFGYSEEQLWVQTSEGPNSSYPKLVIVAQRTATAVASYAASHPTPHPVVC